MAFLIGSSHREFQSEVSGGMETSQTVITPGENYPGLKANRASLLSLRGMFKWLKAVECYHHRRGVNDVEQTEKSRYVEEWEALLRMWGVTAQMLRLTLCGDGLLYSQGYAAFCWELVPLCGATGPHLHPTARFSAYWRVPASLCTVTFSLCKVLKYVHLQILRAPAVPREVKQIFLGRLCLRSVRS